VLVRYNTGLHISHNGRGLAALLEELHEAWGPRLGRIRVIGHSMGGLVARSALEHLRRANAPVLEHVDQLFLLATPNQGADLERLGHAVEYALEQLTHAPDAWLLPGRGRDDGGGLWTPMALLDSVRSLTRATTAMPFRAALRVLAMRSDGMRDVRFGYMMAEEWESAAHDRDRFMLNHRRPIPPPDHVRTFCIAGSLWPEVGASPSPLRTDGLVSTRSAAGIGDDFDDLRVVEHGRYVEFPLLVHQLVAASQRVVEQMRRFSRVSSI
jgi:pimeloyl-ACP methyl ester carboxylesterase